MTRATVATGRLHVSRAKWGERAASEIPCGSLLRQILMPWMKNAAFTESLSRSSRSWKQVPNQPETSLHYLSPFGEGNYGIVRRFYQFPAWVRKGESKKVV